MKGKITRHYCIEICKCHNQTWYLNMDDLPFECKLDDLTV